MEITQQVYDAIYAGFVPSNVTSNLNTSYNMIPLVLAFGAATAMLAILFYTASDIKRFRKFTNLVRIFKFLARTLSYAAYGGLTVVIIIAPCLLLFVSVKTAQANAGSILPILKWLGLIVGAYIGLAGIGWFMKGKVWSKLFKYYREEKQTKEKVNVN